MTTEHTYTQSDIDNLITENAEESVHLEFKAGGALRKENKVEISKDVSAMANSDGGVIIYGIEEKDHKASSLKFIDGNDFTKEWLEQIIHNRIQRKIDGLIIDPIRYDGKIEQTIYVVKIPRSFNAPHMTLEKKFYKRYNFMAVEMEEYEVRNSYNRQEQTQLEILFPSAKFDIRKDLTSAHCNLTLQFNFKNIGESIEKLYKLELRLNFSSFNQGVHTVYNERFRTDNSVRYEGTDVLFSIYDPSPLFQDEIKSTQTISLKIDANSKDHLIVLKLFYSNGIENRSFKISDIFEHYGQNFEETFKPRVLL